jgi:hypothetical protein
MLVDMVSHFVDLLGTLVCSVTVASIYIWWQKCAEAKNMLPSYSGCAAVILQVAAPSY